MQKQSDFETLALSHGPFSYPLMACKTAIVKEWFPHPKIKHVISLLVASSLDVVSAISSSMFFRVLGKMGMMH